VKLWPHKGHSNGFLTAKGVDDVMVPFVVPIVLVLPSSTGDDLEVLPLLEEGKKYVKLRIFFYSIIQNIH